MEIIHMAIRIPGITVRIVNDTGIIVPPLFQRFPVDIGEGDPYRLVSNSQITRGAGSSDTLPSVMTVNEIVSVGDLPGIASYVAGTDYSLIGNTVNWSGAAQQPTAGDAYYVSFTETRPASAYIPMLYLDENLIYEDHGNSIRTDGSINDISVAGSLGLNVGAGGVIIAQLDLRDATDPNNPTNKELEDAFIAMRNELDKITDYKLFLVPLSSGKLNTTSAANIFFNHAVLCSQPEKKQERTVIAALEKDVTYQNAATYAQTYGHERMVVPSVPDTTVHVTGFTGDFDMRFYNAVLAGKLCSVPIGREISDEILPNISFDDNYTPNELNYLVQRGVSPGKISGEVARNVMAITTDPTSALTESLGVQDIADYTKKIWREGLWAVYKNAPITKLLPGMMTSSSKGLLAYQVAQGTIAEYRAVSVAQDKTEPRKMNASAKIKPAFGMQWMDITFTFVLSFG
jgi:hypothetical protein